MFAGEGEAGGRMIESRDVPLIHVVTGFAGRGKTRGLMIHGLGLLELRGVAAGARRAQPHVDARRSALVAGVTGQRPMRAQQREPVLVAADGGLWSSLPSPYGVAVFALCPELAAVQVGVAVGALHRSFGKNARYVARITRNIFVHATQRESRLGVVAELGLRAERGPTGDGVAVLAGDVNGTVRVPGRRLRHRRGAQPQPDDHPDCQPQQRAGPLLSCHQCPAFAPDATPQRRIGYLSGRLECSLVEWRTSKDPLGSGNHLRRKPVPYRFT